MDLVIGLDSSTTATKAIAWDARGRLVAEGRAPVPMSNPAPAAFEQAPEDWWGAAAAALRRLTAAVDPGRIAALAISNQRETLGFLDAEGRSVRPAILWLDGRARRDVALLSESFGAERLHRITGRMPDLTPSLYTLHWLRRVEPEAFRRTAHFVDVHGYLAWRLTGLRATSAASADPHAVFDMAEKRYSTEILGHIGLDEGRFFAALPPGTAIGMVTPEAAAATGLRPGTIVAAGGGDGQAAGLGCGVLGGGRAYLNLGTATVAGVHSRAYRTDAAFRTELALDNEGYILELCLRTGAFLTEWLVRRLLGFDPGADPGCYDRLEAEAEALPPGADGLLLLPYWSGVMCPHWDPDARGALVGLAPEHGPGHAYRALVEGIALDCAMGFAAMEASTGEPVTELLAIGGGARSRLWRQVMADATNRPVTASETVEASALGAGMLAAVAAGWYGSPSAAARAMEGAERERHQPDPSRAARYAELLAIYRSLYPALRESFARLAAFRGDNT